MNHSPTTRPPPVEILVVEDSPTQAERLSHVLERHDFRVTLARNGREALARMRERVPTIVISDVMMPGMSGYDLCRTAKEDPDLKSISFVLLTALSDPVDVVRGLEAGADNFIMKPYEEEYLISRLSFLLANRMLRQHEPMQMALEISFAGQSFKITSDRLQILNVLLSTYETAVQRNLELIKVQHELQMLAEHLEEKVRARTASLEAENAERKRAEAALRREKEYIGQIVSAAPTLICVMQRDGTATFVNPTVARVTGYSVQEIIGKNWWRLLHPEDAYRQVEQLFGDFQRNQIHNYELTLMTKSGAHRVVSWNLVNRLNEAGAVIEVIGIGVDVTEKKQFEEQILRNQRLESVGALASGIAHDLNNVLSPIIMGVDMLRYKLGSDMGQRLLDTLESSARRGTNLVKQVLTFARGAQGQRTLVQPGHLIKEVVRMARETFPKSIAIEMYVATDLWCILGDPTRFDQVLLNLCVNARDALLPNGGRIAIKAENVIGDPSRARLSLDAQPGPFVRLTVADTGKGISSEVLGKIFEPFFTTKDPGTGTGLGLATVVSIVKSHGGFLDVQSQVGQGSVFQVFLPAHEGAAPPPVEPVNELLPTGQGELILVVDDEPSIQNLARQVLSQAGYEVVTADDGSQAVAQLVRHQERIRAIVLDMMMPVMDGLNTIRAVRRINPNLPIIATSGMEEKLNASSLAELQVQDRLTKPYSVKDLIKAVHRLVHGEDALNGES